MAGPLSLRTKKGLLTRYSNNLRRLIDEIQDSRNVQRGGGDSLTPSSVNSTVFDLRAYTKLLTDVFDEFTTALDMTETLSEEQEIQLQGQVDASVKLIDHAQRLTLELERENLEDGHETTVIDNVTMAPPTLPAIPIPVFSEQI